MKHTPPEWTVEPMAGGGFLVRGTGGLRALVTGPNAEADATLIAAAPHLLNACILGHGWAQENDGGDTARSAASFALNQAGIAFPT